MLGYLMDNERSHVCPKDFSRQQFSSKFKRNFLKIQEISPLDSAKSKRTSNEWNFYRTFYSDYVHYIVRARQTLHFNLDSLDYKTHAARPSNMMCLKLIVTITYICHKSVRSHRTGQNYDFFLLKKTWKITVLLVSNVR